MRRLLLTFFSIVCFLSIFSTVFAVTVDISNCPTSITDQSFECNFSVEGAAAGTNYLRIDLYKDGTSNYFGETFVNNNWYGGSDGKQYLPIATTSGSIKGRIGNPSATEFPNSGNYKIKIRRYTNSGNPASGDQQIPKDIEINYQIPTPTPSPTPTPTDEPIPTDTPTTSPTVKPSPTPTPIKKPTIAPTKLPTSKLTPTPNKNSDVNLPQSILGTAATISANPSPTLTKPQTSIFSFNNLLIASGGVVLILSGVFILTFVVKNRFNKI